MKQLKWLQSWLKEERRDGHSLRSERLPLAALWLGVVLSTVAVIRHIQEQQHLRAENDTILSVVESSIDSLSATAKAWSNRHSLSSKDSADSQQLAIKRLRDDGLIQPNDQLLVFSASRQLQLAFSNDKITSARKVDPCVQDKLEDGIPTEITPIACRVGEDQIQLGILAPLQGKDGRIKNALAILRPIQAADQIPDEQASLQSTLGSRLRWRHPARLEGDPLLLRDASRSVSPLITRANGMVLALLQPSLPLLERNSLLPELALIGIVTSALVATRAVPMLGRRRNRLRHHQLERLASQRIRRTSQRLDLLLERIGHRDSSSNIQPIEDEVIAKLLGSDNLNAMESHLNDGKHLSAQVESKMVRLATSYEGFLSAVRSLALFDSLTELPNRRYFFERLDIESQRSRRSGTSFVIMFIDVDKFKMINDSYGHHIGDAALITVADRIRQICRKEDFISRYGGDEFAMIMDLSNLKDKNEENIKASAYHLASRITALFDEPMNSGGISLPLSLSIGITLVDSQEADISAAIQRSDVAMYQAKKQIESKISIFDTSHNQHELDSYRLFADLQTALSRHDLRILYQPIVEIGKGLHSLEALVRWRHPELGYIPPDVLLNIADRYRLTLPLGIELISLAARGYASARASLGTETKLSLNISGRLLSQPDMGKTILDLLISQQVEPEKVILEITEQSVVEMGRITEDNLTFLVSSGMELSLDDFGTGHSSLMRLITLQPSELKIDKAFVSTLKTDPNAMRVVNLVTGLAHKMNLRVVAEGVETLEISQLLLKLGIHHQQGWYFSKARTSGDLIAGGQGAFNQESDLQSPYNQI